MSNKMTYYLIFYLRSVTLLIFQLPSKFSSTVHKLQKQRRKGNLKKKKKIVFLIKEKKNAEDHGEYIHLSSRKPKLLEKYLRVGGPLSDLKNPFPIMGIPSCPPSSIIFRVNKGHIRKLTPALPLPLSFSAYFTPHPTWCLNPF